MATRWVSPAADLRELRVMETRVLNTICLHDMEDRGLRFTCAGDMRYGACVR